MLTTVSLRSCLGFLSRNVVNGGLFAIKSRHLRLLFICVLGVEGINDLSSQTVEYSFPEAQARMRRESNALKAAEAEVRAARHEKQRIRALWWPQIQADGLYLHLSEKVEVREPLSRFTNPAKAYVQSLVPDEQLVTGLLDKIGEYTLSFPLLPQNVASVGLTAEWIAFSGGKRVFANRMAGRLVDVAQVGSERMEAVQQVELVERYYGLVLARKSAEVCRRRYEGLHRHYINAVRMQDVGMIDKATRLAAQVAAEEAEREWHHAESVEQVRQKALKQLLGITDEGVQVIPTSPLFAEMELPDEIQFVETMRNSNYTLAALSLEGQMADDRLRMELGGYLPEVALFGKQTLYAHGLPGNLLPRTVVGIGFTWNLFDGLEREHKVAQTRLTRQVLTWNREEVEEELTVVVAELYATMRRAMADMRVLDSSIALGEELLRMLRSSFSEGMATSSELIDAENTLAASRLARLTAQYTCDVTLANLLSVCGMDSLEGFVGQVPE